MKPKSLKVLLKPSSINLNFMKKPVFYHAGCSVCVSAEHDIVNLIGAENIEIIHLGNDRNKIAEAENAGVKSVPALVTPNGNVLYINFGASMEDVKK
jgi:glutaredoxin 3